MGIINTGTERIDGTVVIKSGEESACPGQGIGQEEELSGFRVNVVNVSCELIGSGNAGPSVTVELSTQFVGGGKPDRPLDAVCEIVRETGSMVFVRGIVEQEDHTVASFSGIVKKMKRRPAS